MSDRQQPVIKKKIRPYPFEGTLEVNAVKKPIEVLNLTKIGAIVRLSAKHIAQVGQYYTLTFELPVSHEFVTTPVRVLKTYDKALDPKEHKVERWVELHFQNLTDEHRSRIVAFIKAIGNEK